MKGGWINLPGIGLLAALAVGCAGQPATPVSSPIPDSPTVAEARTQPERYTGARVRWGGTIAAVENRADSTWVEIVARQLGDNGRPLAGDDSGGRFIARMQGFAEPLTYRSGRAITVVGSIAEFVTGQVGQFDYRYPVVDVEYRQLWQPQAQVQRYPDYPPPFFYDPWYPFYAPYPWRYGYWPYW